MIEQQALTELTQEIMSQGYDEATASRYAVLLGDTPIFDRDGRVYVIDGTEMLATLKPLRFFSE